MGDGGRVWLNPTRPSREKAEKQRQEQKLNRFVVPIVWAAV